jgi:SAM-dependent methyltransferase
VDASGWDERYSGSELLWGMPPNRWVEAELADADPGRALDLACGEGRNALWLAERGWKVTAVDFSGVAIERGRELDTAAKVQWVQADVTTYHPAVTDLALICYLQLAAHPRRAAVRAAAAALAPGGVLLVIAHDSRNLMDGTGGPQEPSVLYTASDVAADIADMGLTIERAGEVLRPVDGADRPAIDCLVRARRGWSAASRPATL